MTMGGRERIQRVLTFITLLAGVLADGNHGAVHPLEEYDDLKPHNDTYHAMQLAGNSFQLLCSARDPIDYCWFQSPNKTMYVPLDNSTDPEYEYYGNGLNSGECGITFHHADVKQTGIWSCNMGTTGPDDIRKLIPVKIYDSGLVTFHRVEGKRVMIGCRTFDNSSMEYCRFVRPDGRGIKAMDGVDKYYGNGTDLVLGSCQITMDRTSDEDLGTWTCAAKSILASHEYTNTIIFTKYSSNNSSFGFNLLCWLFYIIVILGLSCLMVSLIYKTKAVSRLQNRAKVIRASFKSKKQFETIA